MNLVSLDLETHKIQPGLLSPPIVCGSSAQREEGAVIPDIMDRRTAVAEFTTEILGNRTIVGANIAYDFGCIAAERPELIPAIFDKYERGEVHDILIAQALDAIAKGYFLHRMIIDPRTRQQIRTPGGAQSKRFSQAIVVDQVLGRTDAKKNDLFRTSYALLEDKPISEWPEVAVQYPKDDAALALEVAEKQIQGHENLHDLPMQAKAAWAMHLMAMWGLRTDKARVEVLESSLRLRHQEAHAAVAHLGVVRPDGTKDTKRLKTLVFEAYLGNPPRTATGEVSTARDVLLDSGNEDLENFAEISEIEKLQDTYLPFLKSGVDRPINVQPNVLLANGRASYDGLIQLLPRKGGVRECFKFRTAGCSTDYAALEACTLAEACYQIIGYSKLGDAINAGKDVHVLFVAETYGVSYEEATRLCKVLKDPVWKDRRQMMKAANYGFPGCMGAFKFTQTKRKEGLKLCLAARVATKCGESMIREWKGREYPAPACEACVHQAEKLRLAFNAMWPEVPELVQYVTRKLMTTDRIESLFSNRIRGSCEVPSGTNQYFSGLAGDGAKRAIWALSKACYTDPKSPLWNARPVVFSHDEAILEMPPDPATWHDAAWEQSRIFVSEMQKVCPRVKIESVPALMRYWVKEAELVTDKNGKIIPWEDRA